MVLSFTIGDYSLGTLRVQSHLNSHILEYPCNSSVICTYYNVVLSPNTYIFELWGAEGGVYGGKGGYTKGVLTLYYKTEIIVNIGSMGPNVSHKIAFSEPAYNGGGRTATGMETRAAGSGGGGTDIRIGTSLYDRILVAGGGGGGNIIFNDSIFLGGAGGGLSGVKGSLGIDNSSAPGGNQDGPGIGDEKYGGSSSSTHSGIFGYGGYGTKLGTHGGGGGGWYGGASGRPSKHSGGGGGSGYILTATSFKPLGYNHNETSFFFKHGYSRTGDEEFPSCSSFLRERGHSGHGCARISIVDTQSFKNRPEFCPRKSLIISFLLFVSVS